jgi:tetratricopeptide (TPR) repeat protein
MTDTHTAIILVTDRVDSTGQRTRVGEDAAESLRRHHDALLADAITARHGTIVKHLGDGVLATFVGAAEAVAAAVAIQQSVDGHFELRVGVSAGDVTIENDDVFGLPVIEASRLCAQAAGGQILVSDLARMLARGRGGHSFESVGALELKGLPDAVMASEVVWERLDDTRVPYPAALVNTSTLPYSGRGDTLEQVIARWEHAAEGEAGLLLISGEPGMGKTRLAIEAAERARRDQGAIVLFGRADEEVASPYRPFAEALGHLIAHAPVEVLDAHIAEFAGSLATMTSALVQRRPDVVPLAASIEEVRATVFDATVDLLGRMGQHAPVMLILDDLHWADEASLLLLRHVGRCLGRQRLLVIGTYRDTDLVRGHHLSSVLADLRRVDGVDRVDLEGLDAAGVTELMARLGGHELDDRGIELANVVLTETEGNPFFVGEILRHLAESGAIYESEGRWVSDAESVADMGVPQGIREVVGRRLDALSPEANAALRTAAVIGQEFDLRVLARALEQSEDELIDALDPVLTRGLLSEMPGEIDRFRFPHALVRQTLYEELSASRRVRVHARIAEAYASMPRFEAAELAHHRIEAAAVIDLDLVAEAAEAAANDAMDTYAWETAIEWIDRALDAADDQDDHGRVRGRLLLARANVRLAATQFAEAREDLTETAHLADAAHDHELLIDAAIAYATAGSAWMTHGDTLGLELVERAEQVLSEGSPRRGPLLCARAGLLLLTPDRDAVVGPAREGLALVRDAAPEFFPRAAMGMGEALRGTADIDELYSVAREIRTVDNPYYNIFGLYWEALALLGRPDLAAVSDVASELIDEGARRRQRVMSWCGYQTRATLHVLFGRFDDAVADIDSMATYADSIGDTGVGAVHYARVSLAMKRRDVGMLVEAISALEKDFPAFSFGNGHIIIGQLDNSLTPAELGAEVAAWVDQALPRLPFSFRSGSIALLAPSLRFASPDTAVRAERELDGFDDIWMSTGCQESSGHCRWTRGLLAMAQGRTDAAIDHYEAALTSHVAAGELTVRANNSYYLVEALLERDLAGDSERARVVAAEAAAIADRVGIIGLADLVTALAD